MEEVKELVNKVEELFEKEQYKEVIALLPDTLLNKYKSSDLYAWRAWAYDRLDKTEAAFKDANNAITLDPTNSFGFTQRASVWVAKEEYDKAIADLNKSIELKPDYERVYFNRGLTWYLKGEYDKAIADLNKAIELKPDNTDAYHVRGDSWDSKGEYDKAIADYNKALEFKPDNTAVYNNRGVLWDSKGEYDKAIADYNKAIEIKPDYGLAFRNRGNAYFAQDNFQKAIEDYEVAKKLDKQNFAFLEEKIILVKEKLEERKILEQSNAIQKDKDEKVKIEKEIEVLINKIRELSKSKVKTVVHYTKVFVAEIYVKSQKSKMQYSNAIYMNDPMEGKVFFDYLDDKDIESAYLNGEKRTETSVYLGSFLPAEENEGEVSHEDELVMWRTYGKDENGKEAAGCSVVLSSDFFKVKTSKKEEPSVKDSSEELLNVVYIRKQKNKKKIVNDSKGQIESAIKMLKQKLIKLIRLRNKYKSKDDFYKDIEVTIFKQLSTISYLFKSADYDFEHEVRVITYMPRNSESIKYRDISEPNSPRKRFYIESYNDILPYIKKIFLGPKVENYQQWSLYFDYEIRQRAKELSAMTDPPHQIRPSDIEIMKSECKFQ
jgi:tetratricopeptide (TPR) repeat protein